MKEVLRILSKVPGKHGIVKVEFHSVGQKVSVLRAKPSLMRYPQYRNVYIRSSQSHAERVNGFNMKKLLDLIPGGTDFVVTSSGRLVSKQEVINRAKDSAQSGDNKRKRVGSTPTSIVPTPTRIPEKFPPGKVPTR